MDISGVVQSQYVSHNDETWQSYSLPKEDPETI